MWTNVIGASDNSVGCAADAVKLSFTYKFSRFFDFCLPTIPAIVRSATAYLVKYDRRPGRVCTRLYFVRPCVPTVVRIRHTNLFPDGYVGTYPPLSVAILVNAQTKHKTSCPTAIRAFAQAKNLRQSCKYSENKYSGLVSKSGNTSILFKRLHCRDPPSFGF